jgi:hypothetical protein
MMDLALPILTRLACGWHRIPAAQQQKRKD